MKSLFNREELLTLLREVGAILVSRRVEATLYVVGGAAIAFQFDARRVTRDVDAAIRSERDDLTEAVALVADRHGLAPDWLNARAAAFLPGEPDAAATEITLPGLRLAVASPEHLIALKLRALRDRDMDDLETLFRHVGITDPRQAAAIHDKLFDDSHIGSLDPDEALYAAQLVFDRAAARGRPLDRR